MKWKKIKKLLREHPYLIVKEASFSMSKARQDLEKDGYPGYLEMVAKAKAISDIPVSTWEIVDRSIARRTKKQTDHSSMLINTLFRFRKLAIVGLCIILLTGFFTLVPAGRALASQVIEFVIEVVEGWGLIKSANSQAPEYNFDLAPITSFPSDIEEVPEVPGVKQQSFGSISEFQSATGLMPCYIDNDLYALQRISYIIDPALGQVLTITYISDGNETNIVQTWGDGQSRMIVPDNQIQGSISVNSIEYVYYWDETDHTLTAFCTLNSSSIKTASKNFNFSLDALQHFLADINLP